jgi:hypothetical protein
MDLFFLDTLWWDALFSTLRMTKFQNVLILRNDQKKSGLKLAAPLLDESPYLFGMWCCIPHIGISGTPESRVNRTLWEGPLLKKSGSHIFYCKSPFCCIFGFLSSSWIKLQFQFFTNSKIWPSYDPFCKTVFWGPKVGPGIIWALASPNTSWK